MPPPPALNGIAGPWTRFHPPPHARSARRGQAGTWEVPAQGEWVGPAGPGLSSCSQGPRRGQSAGSCWNSGTQVVTTGVLCAFFPKLLSRSIRCTVHSHLFIHSLQARRTSGHWAWSRETHGLGPFLERSSHGGGGDSPQALLSPPLLRRARPIPKLATGPSPPPPGTRGPAGRARPLLAESPAPWASFPAFPPRPGAGCAQAQALALAETRAQPREAAVLRGESRSSWHDLEPGTYTLAGTCLQIPLKQTPVSCLLLCLKSGSVHAAEGVPGGARVGWGK